MCNMFSRSLNILSLFLRFATLVEIIAGKEMCYVDSVTVTRYGGSPTDTFRLRVDTADTSSLTNLKDGFAQNVSGTCGTLSLDPYEKVCIFECQCSKNTPSFDAFEQKCIAENVLKKGESYKDNTRQRKSYILANCETR